MNGPSNCSQVIELSQTGPSKEKEMWKKILFLLAEEIDLGTPFCTSLWHWLTRAFLCV